MQRQRTVYELIAKIPEQKGKKKLREFNGSNFISVKVTDADALDGTKTHAARFV
ncbi:MAG TPA: hypothetical protein VJ729_00300 [Nitrososphaeraceae archaeon]|nr:hypothetical protein [Nitrososphaeraceae archaeon]